MGWVALDHQVALGRGIWPALIAADERGGRRVLTYDELLAEVRRVAAALRAQGIGRGDRVTIYMPTTVEAIVAMLATCGSGPSTRSSSPASAPARSATGSGPAARAWCWPRT